MRRYPILLPLAVLAASATSSPRSARAEDAPPPAATAEVRAPAAPARDACLGAPAPDPRGPPPAARLWGEANEYTPFAHVTLGKRCMQLELPLSLAGRAEGVSSFPLDRYGTSFGGPSASPEVRVGGRFSSGAAWAPFALLVEGEADLLTGVVAPDPGVAGQGFPGSEGLAVQLRKLHARASFGKALHLDVGAQTNHFGMGLVANDGAHDWQPGSASFNDPRGGDRVLRAELSTGPLTPLGLAAAFGVDKVLGDDVLLAGDSARQVFGALLVGVGKPVSGGAYIVRRHQENAAGVATDVTVFDVTGKATLAIPGAVLGLETEWALVSGTTGLGATLDYPTHDVLELGGAARASIDAGALGAVLDFLYASGDQNPYDHKENGFRVDPNFAFSLLLFRQVMAAQSARTTVTAADPLLAARAPQDLERVPTRGSATNTVAFSPKLRVRPLAGLEVYGGPIFAFANVANIDAFNTEISGGTPRSPLGGPAGRYLGTELDLGVRYRMLLHGSELTLGVEAGVLEPGDAYLALDETRMGAVYGGRGMARYRF
jgi:hypothetical protein